METTLDKVRQVSHVKIVKTNNLEYCEDIITHTLTQKNLSLE
jgi:hypothetical protein